MWSERVYQFETTMVLMPGSYYIRSRPKVKAQQFTVNPNMKKEIMNETKYEVCDSCSG